MTHSIDLDLDYVRSQFPGLDNGWTFFDNAGGTQILSGALERMNEFLINRNVQTGGSYAVSQAALQSLNDGRRAMQLFLNAERAEEIVFAPSTTVAMQNLARAMTPQLKPGDEIIVTVSDHESNIGPWVALESVGVQIRYWNIDRDSLELDIEELQRLMTSRTRLVAVTLASNILGTQNDLASITKVAHDGAALVCVDAVALAPHRAIDVQALDVDFLALSLYKVYGPHYAVMYGRHELLLELDNLYHYFYGRDKVPAKLEPGNASYELAYATTGIVDYLVNLGGDASAPRKSIERAFSAITAHECYLASRLLEWLDSRSDCRIVGRTDGSDTQRMPTISFKVAGRDSGDIARRMDDFNIAIRFGDFHARRLIEYLDIADQGGVIRVSMVHYNSIEEVDALVRALDQIL